MIAELPGKVERVGAPVINRRFRDEYAAENFRSPLCRAVLPIRNFTAVYSFACNLSLE